MKKLINIFLFALVFVSLFSFTVSAEEKPTTVVFEEGTVRFVYDEATKTITISGTGTYSTDQGRDRYATGDYAGVKLEAFDPLHKYRKITEKVIVQEGITAIGSATFAYFENLQTVELPDTLTSIEHYAFYECYKLRNIVLPESLEKIGFEAFRSCKKLTELNIPKNVSCIEENFIFDAVNLEKLTVNSKNQHFSAKNNVLYNKNKTQLIAVAPKQTVVKIPKTVTKISDLAFALSEVKEVVIPNTVTKFGKGTFYKSDVEKLTFQKVAKIKEIADFDLYYGDGEREAYGAFEGCKNLKSLVIPHSVKKIGGRTLHGCTSLQYLFIGENLEKNTSLIFYDCKNLRKITVSKKNDEYFMKNGALYMWDKYRKKTVLDLVFVTVDRAKLKIAPETQFINEHAFAHGSIEEIVIPKNVSSIGNGAFYNCKNLKSVTFEKDSGLKHMGCNSQSVYYGYCCYNKIDYDNRAMFYNCKKLKNVTLPESVTDTCLPLFNKCKNLKSVYFGKNFTPYYGTYDFTSVAINCASFSDIKFSKNNPRYISEDGIVYSKERNRICYYSNSKTNKTFVLPDGVRLIEARVFKDNKYLKRIKFVYEPKRSNLFGFGTDAFGDKTVLVKKNSNAHKALLTYQENYICKVNIKFY